MVNSGSSVRLLMLVISSLGNSPLWMHHALYHQTPTSQDLTARESVSFGCGHGCIHCTKNAGESQKVAPYGEVTGDHDCFVCCSLKQSPQRTIAVHLTSLPLPATLLCNELCTPNFHNPCRPSARAPPTHCNLVYQPHA